MTIHHVHSLFKLLHVHITLTSTREVTLASRSQRNHLSNDRMCATSINSSSKRWSIYFSNKGEGEGAPSLAGLEKRLGKAWLKNIRIKKNADMAQPLF